MKNFINYTHIANVLNIKRGFNRPMKVNVRTFRFFEEMTDENAKLVFAPVQITIEKMMDIASIKGLH